ncbi:hypothetical protein MAR_037630, partial [Mya arenaria]
MSMKMFTTWMIIFPALPVAQFCFELLKVKNIEAISVRESETGGGIRDRRAVELNTRRQNNLYRNIFQIRRQLWIARRRWKANQHDILRSESADIVDKEVRDIIQGDGDSCCPTMFYFHKNTTLRNVDGVMRRLIHMPPYYQWIPHGKCLGGGNCGGVCISEPVMLHLLTLDYQTNDLLFEAFEVP